MFVAAWICRQPLLTTLARWLDVGTAPQPTDYVYVLNGDLNVRPFIGAALVNAGYSDSVLLVPMKQPPKRASDPTPPAHEIARQVMVKRGVEPKSIEVIDGLVASTFDEAESLRKYLETSGKHSATVSIVASNFHTRRTRWVFRQLFGPRSENLRFVAAPTDGYDATNWWRVEDGFMIYGTEFLKFGFYVFRYGHGLLISGCAILLAVATAMVVRAAWSKRTDRLGIADAA